MWELNIKIVYSDDAKRWLKKNKDVYRPLGYLDDATIVGLFKMFPDKIIQYVRWVCFVPPRKKILLKWGMNKDAKDYILYISPTNNKKEMLECLVYLLASISANFLVGNKLMKDYERISGIEESVFKLDNPVEDFIRHFTIFLLEKDRLRKTAKLRIDSINNLYQTLWRMK